MWFTGIPYLFLGRLIWLKVNFYFKWNKFKHFLMPILKLTKKDNAKKNEYFICKIMPKIINE